MLTTRSRRPRPGSARFEVEALEDRFLCASGGVAPVAGPPVLSGSPDPAGATDAVSAQSVTGDGGPSAGALPRVDTFVLPAGARTPEVDVSVQWGSESSPTGGILVLTDAAGSTLARGRLDQVTSLDQLIAVPLAPGEKNQGSWLLDLDIAIVRGDGSSAAPGYYQLSLSWRPGCLFGANQNPPSPTTLTPTTTAPPPPAPDQLAPGLTNGTAASSPPAALPQEELPSFSIVRSLPSAAAGPLATGSPPGNDFGPGVPLPILPAGPTHPNALPPGRGATAAGGLGSSASGPVGPGLIVGPLPLGSSTPDGGIFARPFAESATVRQVTSGTNPTPGARPIPTPGDGASPTPPNPTQPGWAVPLDWVGSPAFGRPAGPASPDDPALVAPSAVGVAVLPTTSIVASSSPKEPEPTPPPPARPRRGRAAGGNPVAATVVVLATSALLIFRLNGPKRVRPARP